MAQLAVGLILVVTQAQKKRASDLNAAPRCKQAEAVILDHAISKCTLFSPDVDGWRSSDHSGAERESKSAAVP